MLLGFRGLPGLGLQSLGSLLQNKRLRLRTCFILSQTNVLHLEACDMQHYASRGLGAHKLVCTCLVGATDGLIKGNQTYNTL